MSNLKLIKEILSDICGLIRDLNAEISQIQKRIINLEKQLNDKQK